MSAHVPGGRDTAPGGRPRARALGIPFPGTPGRHNCVTDVAGVEVGVVTLLGGEEGPGRGPAVRTGVTAIFPRGRSGAARAVLAGYHALNGNGEMTGTAWIQEHGYMTGPIMLTSTNSVGVVRDATAAWLRRRFADLGVPAWLPVVGETWDGYLHDIDGCHVTARHVDQALDGARGGPVEHGSVGGGTGMICYEYKGGNGGASRRIRAAGEDWTVGVHLQTNFGNRLQLTVAGIPVGTRLREGRIFEGEHGSVIGVVVTDAPLLGQQLTRLARRVALGLARTGAIGGSESGDLFLAVSTANDGAMDVLGKRSVEFLHDHEMDPLFTAVVEATEESVIDSMVVNDAMTGVEGRRVPALPIEELLAELRHHRRV
ncbi:P1 family peptidase [Actinomadura viridis]|uniref:DmpA family aminopeptidase n=1 Tax=Actinomadura viridis TaxID=58110 RepID=UPI0036B0DB98